jgi:hypothetical protein
MRTDSKTLGESSHTTPDTGHVFGETQAYTRGQAITADGNSAAPSDDSGTLTAVSHTSEDISVETDTALCRGVRENNE